MAGPAPGHGNGYPRRGMSPFSPPGRPVFRPPFLMRRSMGEGGRGPFSKKVPFPPHAPPILPKTFIQVCHGPSWRTGQSSSPSPPVTWALTMSAVVRMRFVPIPPVTCRKIWMEKPVILAMAGSLGTAILLPALPLPASPATVPAGCRKTDALFKRRTILYKIRLFPAFSRRGADSRPAAQRRRPVIPTRTKVLRGDGGAGEGGRFFQKRPPSPGLASPEARYHAHVRSSPDRGIRP